jgi:hypothetical protein
MSSFNVYLDCSYVPSHIQYQDVYKSGSWESRNRLEYPGSTIEVLSKASY